MLGQYPDYYKKVRENLTKSYGICDLSKIPVETFNEIYSTIEKIIANTKKVGV